MTKGDEGGVDPVLEGGSVMDEMESIASSFALGSNGRVGQPDRRHEIASGKFGEHASIDLVGLSSEWRKALGLDCIGDRHVPATELELVVHEAGAVHRLDRCFDGVSERVQARGEGVEGIGIGTHGEDRDHCPVFIEDVDIEPLARQVQSGVQHTWASWLALVP